VKKYLLPSALILALGLSLAWAQNINKAVQLSQDPTGMVGYDTGNNIYLPGHLLTTTRGSPAPVASACGSTGLTNTGTDLVGQITVGGSAATACTLTFGTAFLAAPTCLLVWNTGPLAAMSWTTSTTAITIAQTSTASDVISYLCTGAK
jgi:hypothetical protein